MNQPTASQIARRLKGRGDAARVLTVAGVFLVAWALGRAVATHSLGFPTLLLGMGTAYLLFFHRTTILWIAPLVMCLPNLGLDIPGPWAITIEDAFVIIAFGALATRNILEHRPIIPRDVPFIVPLFVFWAIAIISFSKVATISPNTQLFIVKDLLRLTMLIMFYMSMTDAIRTKENVLTVIRTLLLLAIPMVVISWYIYLTESAFFYDLLTMRPAYVFYKGKILRMISIMGTTRYSGLYFALVLALGFTYPGLLDSKRMRGARGFFLAVVFSCLALTMNRGTWAGVLFGLSLLMFIGEVTWRKVTAAGFLIAGVAIIVSLHFFSHFDVEQKLSVLIEISRSSGTARIVRWLSAVNVIQEQPLLGVGYNNYAFVYGHYSIKEGLLRVYGSPHNMYVDIITGTGVVGFTVFAIFLRRLWKMHTDILRQTRDPALKSVALGLFLALTFFLGSSAFDSFLFKPHHTTFLIFLLWALATAVWRLNREGQNASAQKQPDSTDEAGGPPCR